MLTRRHLGWGAALSVALAFASSARAADEPRRGGTLNAIIQPEPVSLTAAVLAAAPMPASRISTRSSSG